MIDRILEAPTVEAKTFLPAELPTLGEKDYIIIDEQARECTVSIRFSYENKVYGSYIVLPDSTPTVRTLAAACEELLLSREIAKGILKQHDRKENIT